MKILAADTSTTAATVAVTDGDRLLASRHRNPGETHSRHLLAMIDGVLEDAGCTLSEMDALVTGIGPGSFTGVRIGVGTLKGIADALEKPLYGISSLDLVAARFAASERPVRVVLDARRGEVYTCKYEMNGGFPVAFEPPRVCSPEAAVAEDAPDILIAGSGVEAFRERFDSLIPEASRGNLRFGEPDVVFGSWLVMQDMGARSGVPAEVLPLYLRKSDAEIQHEKRAEDK